MRVVDLGLDGADILGRERLRLAEVEAQAVGRHQRALLGDVGAEPPAQRLVQQVGGRVVGAQRGAALAVDPHLHGVADGELALWSPGRRWTKQVAEFLLGVVDGDLEPPGAEHDAAIAHLAAGLAIERSLVGDDGNLRAGLGRLDRLAVDQERSTLPSATSVA